jgi:cell division protein FtsB
MNTKDFLSSKIAVLLLLAFLAFFGNLRYKQWEGHKAIEREKAILYQQEQAQLQKNRDLQESLSYLSSPDFKEKVARQQLNLKKEGELVFTFSEPETESQEPAQDGSRGATNPQKWWNYFFQPKS